MSPTAREIGDGAFKALALRRALRPGPVPDHDVRLQMPADATDEEIRLARASGFMPVFDLNENQEKE